MQELDFKVSQSLGTLTANFDEIKDALALQMSAYADLDLSEESIKERKSDLATLRKIRRVVDDRRKEIKKSFNEPYVVFENEVKGLIALIDEPINTIDSALKSFEAQRVEERKNHNRQLYNEAIGDYAEYLPFEYLDRQEWLNKSTSDKIIVDAIQTAIITCQNAIQAIKALNSPIEEELLAIYARSHDMSLAVKRATDYTRDLELIKKIEQAPITVAPVEEPSIVELTEEEAGEIINKAEIVAIYVKAEDYDRAKNVLMFNEIEIW